MIHLQVGSLKTEDENPFPFPSEILTESPEVSEDLLPPMFEWPPNLDWSPFDMAPNTFGPDQIMNSSTSIGRSVVEDMNDLGVELDNLMTDQQQQQHPSIITFESCAPRTTSYHHPVNSAAALPTPEEVFRPPTSNPPTVHRLPTRVQGVSVHSHMAMACHDYTNKLSYTLTTSSTNSNHHFVSVPATKSEKSKSKVSTLPVVVTKKSHKSRSSVSGTSGRKGKSAEDPDYLAHGTGIPR